MEVHITVYIITQYYIIYFIAQIVPNLATGDSSRLVSHQEDTVPCGELVVAQLPCADPPARSLARSPWNTAQTGDHLL